MRLIIFFSLLSTLFLYLSMACSGYLRFGSSTEGDILNNLPDEYIAGIIAKLGLSIGISLSYPLCFHPIRYSFFTLILPHLNEKKNQNLKNLPYVFVSLEKHTEPRQCQVTVYTACHIKNQNHQFASFMLLHFLVCLLLGTDDICLSLLLLFFPFLFVIACLSPHSFWSRLSSGILLY
jgi:amino acid permease